MLLREVVLALMRPRAAYRPAGRLGSAEAGNACGRPRDWFPQILSDSSGQLIEAVHQNFGERTSKLQIAQSHRLR